MDFETLSSLGSLLSKGYSREFLRLLVTYRDISASEAASRLSLHIKTAQDFLEGLYSICIVSRVEVHESKRPYFRYSIERERIDFQFDLALLRPGREAPSPSLGSRVRERKSSGALFKTSSRGDLIATVTFFTGNGRSRSERTLNLTRPQGTFLYHLPFPTEPSIAAGEIMRKAGIDESYAPEILDLIDFLEDHGIVECERPA